MYALTFTDEALEALPRIPANAARLIRKKLEHPALDPMRPNNNVKSLRGQPGYRLRVGDWRVIYRLERKQLVVHVIRIGPRGSVYE